MTVTLTAGCVFSVLTWGFENLRCVTESVRFGPTTDSGVTVERSPKLFFENLVNGHRQPARFTMAQEGLVFEGNCY